MRLNEFLIEAADMDKTIVQLATIINNDASANGGKLKSMKSYVAQLPDHMKQMVGNALDNIKLKAYTGQTMFKKANPGVKADREQSSKQQGMWQAFTTADGDFTGNDGILGINKDTLGTRAGTGYIAHELRHAFDDIQSRGATIDSPGYINPRKKEHQQGDRYTQYIASPSEINARFLSALEQLTRGVPIAYKQPEEKIKAKMLSFLDWVFEKFEISKLFPEKEKSKDYKQLVKRAMLYIQQEMKEYEAKLEAEGTPKHATGSW